MSQTYDNHIKALTDRRDEASAAKREAVQSLSAADSDMQKQQQAQASASTDEQREAAAVALAEAEQVYESKLQSLPGLTAVLATREKALDEALTAGASAFDQIQARAKMKQALDAAAPGAVDAEGNIVPAMLCVALLKTLSELAGASNADQRKAVQAKCDAVLRLIA